MPRQQQILAQASIRQLQLTQQGRVTLAAILWAPASRALRWPFRALFKWWSAPSRPQIDYSFTWTDSKAPLFFAVMYPIISLQSAAQWWRPCIRGARGITPRGAAIVTVFAITAISGGPSHRVMRGLGTVIIELGDAWWRQRLGFCWWLSVMTQWGFTTENKS